jgi:hypothetical protein
MENSIETAFHYIDFTCKILCDHYQQEFLQLLGINTSATLEPTEIKNILTSFHRLDSLLKVGENDFIDLEFDGNGDKYNIIAFCCYASLFCSDYYKKYSIIPNFKTIVLYPGNVKNLPSATLSMKGSLNYTIEQISLNDLIDGEEVYTRMKKEIESDKTLNLSQNEKMELILTPLGKISENQKDFKMKFLDMALSLYMKINDGVLFGIMCTAVGKKNITASYQAKVKQMTNQELVDIFTDGEYSALVNKYQAAENKAAAAEIKAAEETKARLDAEAKAAAAELKALKDRAKIRELEAIIANMQPQNN